MLKFRRIGAALFTFAKPNVTKQVITSILANRKVGYEIDWHIFQDGAVNDISELCYASDEEVAQTLKTVKNSGLPYKSLTINEHNEGIARQKHKAHQLFEDYDLIYFFEDDLLLGNYYLRLLKVLAQSFPRQVGTLHKHFNNGPYDTVYSFTGEARLWGYYMPRQVYVKIERGWNKYYERVKNLDYIGRKMFGVKRAPRHDINLSRIIQASGSIKLWPCITRARNIGQYGHIAFQKGGTLWKRNRLHLQPTKISYPRYDKGITQFRRR